MAEDVETGLSGFGGSLDGRGEVVNAPAEARIRSAIHDGRKSGGRDRLAGGHWSQGLNLVTGWTGWRLEVVDDVRQSMVLSSPGALRRRGGGGINNGEVY